MKLYMPTKVYNEKGCVRQHSQELAELGTKALLVTGKHSSRVNGSLQDVEDALNREQVPYVVFDGIEENPSVETVMRVDVRHAVFEIRFLRRVAERMEHDLHIGVVVAASLDLHPRCLIQRIDQVLLNCLVGLVIQCIDL